jgi:hypothetical protein
VVVLAREYSSWDGEVVVPGPALRVVLTPLRPPAPVAIPRGRGFWTPDGQRYRGFGATAFCLALRWADGQDISATLQWYRQVGIEWPRFLTM